MIFQLKKTDFIKHKKNQYIKKMSRITQPAFTCSKLTIETQKQGVKYAQS